MTTEVNNKTKAKRIVIFIISQLVIAYTFWLADLYLMDYNETLKWYTLSNVGKINYVFTHAATIPLFTFPLTYPMWYDLYIKNLIK